MLDVTTTPARTRGCARSGWHADRQAARAAAYAAGRRSIACRSAASGAGVDDRELAVFDRDVAALATQTGRLSFADWYLDTGGS